MPPSSLFMHSSSGWSFLAPFDLLLGAISDTLSPKGLRYERQWTRTRIGQSVLHSIYALLPSFFPLKCPLPSHSLCGNPSWLSLTDPLSPASSLYTRIRSPIARWFRTANNWDVRDMLLARTFAYLLTPLTRSLAPHCLLSSAAPSLTQSLSRAWT